jgi:outer membrane protein
MAKPFISAVALIATLGACGAVLAQPAGSVIVRAGATRIAPDVTSGSLSAPSFAGTTADVTAANQISGGVTWMWTDNIALDLPLAPGFEHDLVGDGAIAGVGKIGEVKALPITLLVQYRFFEPQATWRPYVGAGPTYARFYDATSTAALTGLTGGSPANPTTLSIDSRWAFTAQLGMVWQFSPKWSLDVAVLKSWLKTTTTLSTGQSMNTKLDPWIYTFGIGYRF